MKKNKEIIWFATTVFFIALLFHIIVGIPALWLEETVAVNIKDTYFVIAPFHFLLLLTTILFFIIYFIRILAGRLKNKIANSVFIIINLLPIYFFGRSMINFGEGQFDYASMLIFILLLGFEIFVTLKTMQRFKTI